MLMSSVCILTACFTPASVAIRWPVRCLIRAPKRCKSLGPILPTGLVTRYGAAADMSWTTLPLVPVSFPVVYICLDHLGDACMTSDSPRTPTWSKPSPPVCVRLTSISSIAGCKHWWQDGTNSYMSVVITWSPDVYRLLWMCRVGLYIEVRINFRHQSLCCNIFLNSCACIVIFVLFVVCLQFWHWAAFWSEPLLFLEYRKCRQALELLGWNASPFKGHYCHRITNKQTNKHTHTHTHTHTTIVYMARWIPL